MRYQRSSALFLSAQKVIPGGVNSPVRAFKAVGGTPVFVEKAKGAYLYDADGNLVATDDDSASDRRNAVLKFKAPKGAEGTYFVEIASSDKSPTSGEYVLAVK